MDKSGFQFTNPVITDLKFETNKNFILESVSDTELYNDLKININKNNEKPEALVELNIFIEPSEANKDWPFKINMVIVSLFSWDNTYDDELLNSLLSINAPALLLSYARPIISYITNNSRFPVYNLPFYNFTNIDVNNDTKT